VKTFTYDPQYMKFTMGDLLYEKCREQGLTNEQVISYSSISRAVFYDILKDVRRMTPQSAIRLSGVIGFDGIEWIMYQAWNDYVEEKTISRLQEEGYARIDAKDYYFRNRKSIMRNTAQNGINDAPMGNNRTTW